MNLGMRHSIVGLILFAANALPPPARAVDLSPKEFLAAIYRSPDKPSVPFDIPCNPPDRAEIGRQFAPAAAKLVSWSLQHVDGCIFTGLDGSEDWLADSVDIAITKSDRQHAVGTVTLTVHGKATTSSPQKSTVILHLVRSGQGWRITDIDYGGHKLSQMRRR